MKNFLPFKGFLCPGIYFSSGYCVWLMQWTSTPTEVEAFSEIWVFTPEDNRTAYIDPVEAVPIFKIYHNFNNVVGAEIIWDFKDSNSLSSMFRASDNTVMEIQLKLGPAFDINAVNEAVTETGMAVRHQSDRAAAIENASASFNGMSLGKIAKPLKPIYVGSAQVPATPVISFCTHYLESS
jgi:hypothetical protein